MAPLNEEHNAITNDPTNSSLHSLHAPGYIVNNATERAAITTMLESDVLYQKDIKQYFFWNNSSWVNFSTAQLGLVIRVSTNYSCLGAEAAVIADCTGGVVTVTLPAVPSQGQVVTVIKQDNTTNKLQAIGAGSNTIGGQPLTYATTATQYGFITFIFDGISDWNITSYTTDNLPAFGGIVASGTNSHAEGQSTHATGPQSHAEGNSTHANGNQAHAEGNSTTAGGNYSHSEGQGSYASGQSAHAEGGATIASSTAAHAEGNSSIASGIASHAGGTNSVAGGLNSFAHGTNAQANHDNSVVMADSSGAASSATNQLTFSFLNGLVFNGPVSLQNSGTTYLTAELNTVPSPNEVQIDVSQGGTLFNLLHIIANSGMYFDLGNATGNTLMTFETLGGQFKFQGASPINLRGAQSASYPNIGFLQADNWYTPTQFQIYSASSTDVALGTNSGTGQRLIISLSTSYTMGTIGDIPSGGDFALPGTSVDVLTSFSISQTTAGQTISIPSPTNTTAGRIVTILNTGTTSFTMLGITLNIGAGLQAQWGGSAWFLLGHG